MQLEGIHHITAITGDAPRNLDFYTRVLGLRLAAKTVNQDDPTVYHLFYADEQGDAGSDLTFFEYPGATPGRPGAGMVHRVVWRVATPAMRLKVKAPRRALRPGQAILATARRLLPHESFVVTVDGVRVAQGTASADGQVRARFRLPHELDAGRVRRWLYAECWKRGTSGPRWS